MNRNSCLDDIFKLQSNSLETIFTEQEPDLYSERNFSIYINYSNSNINTDTTDTNKNVVIYIKIKDYIDKEIIPPESTKTKVNVKDEDNKLDFDTFDICSQYKKKGECKCSELSSDVIHSDYNFLFCLQYKIIYCDGTFSIERPHPKFLCKHPIKRKDHNKKICGFYISNILMIEDLSKIEDKFNEYIFAI
ncbi:hypothetical protein C1645_836392 [Glomus cerebriforme]|uniref:Uncharacterized protein n=1 Tax=Glomus cerebriforme TaxID=658196 RepID=A0A397SH51_9GLOM|nr:hypothetical protein C1645_836392 [Glomus cerebriforme]